MKGKRHTTEHKIHILREADGGEIIVHQPKPKTNTPPGPVFGTRSESALPGRMPLLSYNLSRHQVWLREFLVRARGGRRNFTLSELA